VGLGLVWGQTVLRVNGLVCGETNGGNDSESCMRDVSVACYISSAALEAYADVRVLAMTGVRLKGERLREGLREAFSGIPHVKEVRGQGLICGVQLDTVISLPVLAFCRTAEPTCVYVLTVCRLL
jgi:acetylornithine/succinyldiaminopimelate/putrescine aminotransferase